MAKVLMTGAAGRIPAQLIPSLIEEGKDLVLYARNASERLSFYNEENVQLVDGDIEDIDTLTNAMKDVDIVYANAFHNQKIAENIKKAMEQANVKRVIVASVLGIYGEVEGKFGEWNESMVGSGIPDRRKATDVLENSNLDYTIMRLTWLYDGKDSEYEITHKGEAFRGAQVTRNAVAHLIKDIIENPSLYSKESIGVNEPNTYYDKPSFM